MIDNIAHIAISSFERAPWGWGLFATVCLAVIKGWPAISDAALRARNAIGDRRLSRIENLERAIAALNKQVAAVTEQSHQTELKLVSALAAYRLIASELQKIDPDSPILKQAQELLNVSYSAPRTIATPADAIRQPESKVGKNR